MAERKKTKKIQKKVLKTYTAKNFLADCYRNDMIYAAIVRSPLNTGSIKNVDRDNIPEGYNLYTSEDIPGINQIHTIDTTTELFAHDKIHYQGEPIGIVTGPDLKKVRRLARELVVNFDFASSELNQETISKNYTRPVIGLNSNQEERNIAIHSILERKENLKESEESLEKPEDNENIEELPLEEDNLEELPSIEITRKEESNVILAQRIVQTGFFETPKSIEEIDKFFSSSEYDITDTWSHEEELSKWACCSGALSYYEGPTLVVMTQTQWPGHIRKTLSDILGLDEEYIEVHKTLPQSKAEEGGWRTTCMAVRCALATYLTKKSVKLLLTKQEQEIFMVQGIKTTVTQRTCINKDGSIRAMQIYIKGNAGYTNPFATEIADRLSIAAASFYAPQSLYINTKIYASDSPPTSIYPEMLDAPAFFAIENHIQHIADVIGMLPTEFRMKNMENPYSTFIYKTAKYEESIDAIVKQSDFNRKYTTFRLNSLHILNHDEFSFFSLSRRGIGLSCAYDGAFFYGTRLKTSEQKMEVTLNLDGTVTINTITPSNNVSEIWKKIASEILHIETSSISIVTNYNEMDCLPENLFSNISIMTLLLKKCCQEIDKKRFNVPLPITAKKSPTMAMRRKWHKEKFTGTPFYTTSFGSAIVEIDLNAISYKQQIKGIWVAIDCGEILSLKDAESTVRLAIRQELEHLVKDEIIPCSLIRISFIQSSNPPCQIGALIHNIIPAAFTSAMAQALYNPLNSMPCTEEQIYELSINKNKATETISKTESKGSE